MTLKEEARWALSRWKRKLTARCVCFVYMETVKGRMYLRRRFLRWSLTPDVFEAKAFKSRAAACRRSSKLEWWRLLNAANAPRTEMWPKLQHAMIYRTMTPAQAVASGLRLGGLLVLGYVFLTLCLL